MDGPEIEVETSDVGTGARVAVAAVELRAEGSRRGLGGWVDGWYNDGVQARVTSVRSRALCMGKA